MPINTRLIRSRPIWTLCRLSTATTCPAISPAVRFRIIPSFAVRQNWQFTAANLAGDTDGRIPVIACVASVAGFTRVTLWHPDRFRRLAVGHRDQVALGSVHRLEGLGNLRKPDGVARIRKLLAQRFGQGRDLIQLGNPLPVEGLGKLRGPVSGY